MTQIDGLRRYIDAATTLTQITRGRAEELVRELVASGEVERTHAQEWIDDLMKHSREASEQLMTRVSSEVEKQLADLGIKKVDVEDIAEKVAGIIGFAATVGRNVTHGQKWDSEAEHSDNGHGKTSEKKQKSQKAGQKSSQKKSSDKKKKVVTATAKAPKSKDGSSKKSGAKKDSGDAVGVAEQKATT